MSAQPSLFPPALKIGFRVRIKGVGRGEISWVGPEWLPDGIIKVLLDSGETWSGHSKEVEPDF